MSWNDERVERLKELWSDGMTASQIAKTLGGVSRNAVIGKVHRLGLSNRSSPGKAPTNDEEEPIALSEKKAAKTSASKASAATSETGGETLSAAKKKTAAAAEAVGSPASDEEAIAKAGDAVEVEAKIETRSDASSGGALATTADAVDAELDELDEDTVNPVAALAAEVERNSRKLSLLELNERTCKWPIGDPSSGEFYFCGLQAAAGKPYCEAHVAVAYQPMSSRRERERDRHRGGRAVSA